MHKLQRHPLKRVRLMHCRRSFLYVKTTTYVTGLGHFMVPKVRESGFRGTLRAPNSPLFALLRTTYAYAALIQPTTFLRTMSVACAATTMPARLSGVHQVILGSRPARGRRQFQRRSAIRRLVLNLAMHCGSARPL